MISPILLLRARRYTVFKSLSVVFGLPVESSISSSVSSYSSKYDVGPTITLRLPNLDTTCMAYPVQTFTATAPSYFVSNVMLRGGV